MYEIVLAVIIGIVLVFVVYSVAFALLSKVASRVQYLQGMEEKPWRSNIIIGPVVLLLSIALIAVIGGENLVEWGWTFPSWELILTALIVSVIAGGIVAGIHTRLSKIPPEDRPNYSSMEFIILIVIIASIAEEFVFRGFLQQYIDHFAPYLIHMGTIPLSGGCIVAAIVFGLVHVTPARQMGESAGLMAGGAGVFGIIAGVMFLMTSSILIPIIIHIIFNLMGGTIDRLSKTKE